MKTAHRVLEALAERGLLLEQDKELPNVVTLLTGQSLRTSWWSHPRARIIFATLTELARHPDVLFTKLLYGKVTLLHRRLWPSFLAVASAREAWQVRSLPASARSLLQALERKGSVPPAGPLSRSSNGAYSFTPRRSTQSLAVTKYVSNPGTYGPSALGANL